MSLISSRSNNKVKRVRTLRKRKARQESKLFIVEGIRHVGEAVESHADLQSIFYAPGLLRSDYANSLIKRIWDQDIPCYPTTDDVFLSLAEKQNPQGILAIVHQPEITLDELNPDVFRWGVAIVKPQDPGNIGTILRTIDAVGANGLILLDNGADPFHPSAVRASMGTIFWHTVVQTTFQLFSQWVNKHNYHVYGTSAHGNVDYRDLSHFDFPRILLMGSEREGLSSEQASICEQLIRLPMLGKATSLNLAVATGIMLYHMLE